MFEMFTGTFCITLIQLMLRMNFLIKKTAEKKHWDIFIRVIQNICIKRVAVLHFTIHLIDFHKQMATVLVLSENDVIYKFIQGLHSFILNWTLVKRKKKVQKSFWQARKPWNIFKTIPERKQQFQSHLICSRPTKS